MENKNFVYRPSKVLQPKNIAEALEYYSIFIRQLQGCKDFLFHDYKRSNSEVFTSEQFESYFKDTFLSAYYDWGIFTEYINNLVLNENDKITLEKWYNLICLKLNELEATTKYFKQDCKYYHYRSLYDPFNLNLNSFISNISWMRDDGGNYKNMEKNYFTCSEFIDGILEDISNAKIKIDKIFTLKSLNFDPYYGTAARVEEKNNKLAKKKIMINCKPAEFAELLKILQKKGWINMPNSGEGIASSLLQIFEFENYSPSKKSLGEDLANGKYNISVDKINELEKIPSLSKINNI